VQLQLNSCCALKLAADVPALIANCISICSFKGNNQQLDHPPRFSCFTTITSYDALEVSGQLF